MTLFVKLCGLSTAVDVEVAVDAGADAIGLVMTDSPRQVSLERAAELRARLPKGVLAVAVFHAPTPELVRKVEEVVSPDLFQATPDALAGIDGTRALPVVVDGPGVGNAPWPPSRRPGRPAFSSTARRRAAPGALPIGAVWPGSLPSTAWSSPEASIRAMSPRSCRSCARPAWTSAQAWRVSQGSRTMP